MSRRLSRSHSTDSLWQYRSQPRRNHHVTFDDDYGSSSSLHHEQDYGIQSEHRQNNWRHEPQERGSRDPNRHVTWEHWEHTPSCPRQRQTSNNQVRQFYWDEPYTFRGSQQHHQSNPPCPIHGFQNHTRMTNARPRSSYDYSSAYAAASSYPLYNMSRPVTSSRTRYVPDEYDPSRRGGWHQRLILPDERLGTHLRTTANHNYNYRNFGPLYSNIHSNFLPFSVPVATDYNTPQFYRPKWRRSVVGLNRWY